MVTETLRFSYEHPPWWTSIAKKYTNMRRSVYNIYTNSHDLISSDYCCVRPLRPYKLPLFYVYVPQEGWQAASLLLGSAKLSLINPTFTQGDHGMAQEDRGGGRHRGTSAGHTSVGSASAPVGRVGRGAVGRQGCRPLSTAAIARPVAPDVDGNRGGAAAVESKAVLPDVVRSANVALPATEIPAAGGTSKNTEGKGSSEWFAPSTAEEVAPTSDYCPEKESDQATRQRIEDRAIGADTQPEQARQQPPPPRQHNNSLFEELRADQGGSSSINSSRDFKQALLQAGTESSTSGDGAGRIGRESPLARDAASARPDGRQDNSRGAAEAGSGSRGGDGLAGEFQRPEELGRRGSSDMEFPIQSQALPDWADTIKVRACVVIDSFIRHYCIIKKLQALRHRRAS